MTATEYPVTYTDLEPGLQNTGLGWRGVAFAYPDDQRLSAQQAILWAGRVYDDQHEAEAEIDRFMNLYQRNLIFRVDSRGQAIDITHDQMWDRAI